jgi:hypothetical protein
MRRREEERVPKCVQLCVGRFERGRKRPTSRFSVVKGYNVPLQLTEDTVASTGR